MKKGLMLVAFVTSTIGFGQNLKSENLDYLKLITPSLISVEKPVDMTVQHLSNSTYIKEIIKESNLQKPYFVNNNTSNPKYIAVVDYIEYPALTSHSKKSINSILIKSNIEAVVYLIEAGKGVFAQDTIKLANKANNTNLDNYSEFSSTISTNLSDVEAAPFFLNGKFPNPAKVKSVDKDQVERLQNIAYRRINRKITDTEEKNRIKFNYLKLDKNFDSKEFDLAYDIVKANLKPVNAQKLQDAAFIFNTELDKYANNSDKKIEKYRIAILENLMLISYLTDDYSNAEGYKKSITEIDDKNRFVTWYTKTEKDLKKRQKENELGKPLIYSKIPTSIINISTDKLVLEQGGNLDDLRIEYVGMPLYKEYVNPVVQLNSIAYKLKALDNKKLFIKYQNDIFNDVLWYMLSYKNNIVHISNADKKVMQDFLDFSEEFSKTVADKKIYSRTDSKAEALAKLREFVSKNYTIQDFTRHSPSILAAVESASTQKRVISTTVYQNALKLNAIIQLRELLADDLYMEEERLDIESVLDATIEEGVTKSYYPKNKTYYEFKKSVDILKSIKNRRSLSEDEYKNYEILILNIIGTFK